VVRVFGFYGHQMASQMHYDAVVVTHKADALKDTLRTFSGFARIVGVRDMGNGQALAVFGKGLKRDLFRPRVRDPLAA
jgi:hypothetical protein